jgi:ATP synthase in type III secretion protein N
MTVHQTDIEDRLASILPRLQEAVLAGKPALVRGRVRRLLGTIVHATVTEVRIGEICHLVDPATQRQVPAEVVGFTEDVAILTPIGDLGGLSNVAEVLPSGEELRIAVGPGLLGRVINALGEPLDGERWADDEIEALYPVDAAPPAPLARAIIDRPVQLGIPAIDGLLTCARGQRVGIFGGPGLGKSTLLGDIVRGTDADVVVVALIGERGREVGEFVAHQLGAEGQKRAVVVAATSDRPAMERVKAAHVAMTIAEYFRDRGAHVLLLMDSLTRFARAQREIGLAAGEPPTRRGYPPSIFAALPRLLERAGPTARGSITGLYTILVEGDISLDPIAEEVQALLDGHILLSPELAQRNHFPAIDVLRSRSRLMSVVAPQEQQADAARIRELIARHADIELLVRVGEYKSGSDALADEAIAKIDGINAFLRQRPSADTTAEATRSHMREILR